MSEISEIKEYIKYIEFKYYIRIVQMIIQYEENSEKIITDHDDGIRIDLDKLKIETLKQIHLFIMDKIDRAEEKY
jgi:hypothetical protein